MRGKRWCSGFGVCRFLLLATATAVVVVVLIVLVLAFSHGDHVMPAVKPSSPRRRKLRNGLECSGSTPGPKLEHQPFQFLPET